MTLSQQAISCIENGKRKVDAERELPAFAAVYGQPIDYFYDSWQLQQSDPLPSLPLPTNKSTVTVDFDALTKRDKLQLAAELIHHVLQET